MENQILLEKIGETKNAKLITDCNKIYMEEFHKQYPNYFESNYLKSITKVITTPKDSTEIKGIGMSCMNDLMLRNFALWLGGYLGATRFANASSPDVPQRTGGSTFPPWGNIKGGSSITYFGRSGGSGNPPNPSGMTIAVGSSLIVPQKNDFNPSNGVNGSRGLVVNAGTFSAGLNTATWSAGNSSIIDFDISSSNVIVRWQDIFAPIVVFALLSDLISPVVPVFSGESIFMEITFQFA